MNNIDERKARIWNGWNSNTYNRSHDGCITHACEEMAPGDPLTRTGAICGARCDDGGGLNLLDDWEPGCIRCRKLLRKWGLMDPAPGGA